MTDGIVHRFRPSLDGPLGGLVLTARVARDARDYTPPVQTFVRSAVAPRRRVLCPPSAVREWNALTKVLAVNRYRLVVDPQATHDVSVQAPSPSGRPVINGRHQDNKKSRVAAAWEAVAGYPIATDPTVYEGRMVAKSEANATHDGRVVEGPIRPDEVEDGLVYQALVDNADGDEVVDLRVTLYGGRVPLAYVKRRPLGDRFSNKNTAVALADPAGLFSVDELAALGQFAGAVGLDYGEADVLRDNVSGRIYVVDATNGPAGPPNGLPLGAARTAVTTLAVAFDDLIDRMTHVSA